MRKTIEEIKSHKNQPEPLVCLTAYTARIAQILDPHCDLLLVGDSMGMVLYGMDSTQGVSLEMMINHGRAVTCGSTRSCVIVDMPFGSYEESPAQALNNARRVMDETGAQGVKLEGGVEMAATIKTLVKAGIPVIGHIGLMPQSVTKETGFRVKGRSADSEAQLLADAKAIEAAGVSAFVIEATIESVAAEITLAAGVPTIGIGASAVCDGQILVSEDMVGITSGHVPKFVKQYAQVGEIIGDAAARYAADVRARAFPAEAQLYGMSAAGKVKKAS
ncbi:MAG TPA: 3-methyl-2-oxobutanoate hydroxymethyltransferase [Alphaproteobacteria bacterium]|nr:3-methyl-2-oxobutanoate hydroxymethyltransferase [Alphaproteobacteria bacterium]USO04921.1 MAG: 3-methyl-2-oxobutanoate hydroxymethyltransferase [Rhodospirillales bacterium]HOO81567.1 3-methyl-2-oxobutanoate hydroxymethyltransferase [Alphaproteobacteria bacterium]